MSTPDDIQATDQIGQEDITGNLTAEKCESTIEYHHRKAKEAQEQRQALESEIADLKKTGADPSRLRRLIRQRSELKRLEKSHSEQADDVALTRYDPPEQQINRESRSMLRQWAVEEAEYARKKKAGVATREDQKKSQERLGELGAFLAIREDPVFKNEYAGYQLIHGYHKPGIHGCDQIWIDSSGNILIVEAKGGSADLGTTKDGFRQMSYDWLVKKALEMRRKGDPNGQRILNALADGKEVKVRGVVLHTRETRFLVERAADGSPTQAIPLVWGQDSEAMIRQLGAKDEQIVRELRDRGATDQQIKRMRAEVGVSVEERSTGGRAETISGFDPEEKGIDYKETEEYKRDTAGLPEEEKARRQQYSRRVEKQYPLVKKRAPRRTKGHPRQQGG